MITSTSFTKSKTIIILGIIAFLAMSFWGLYSMPNNEHGGMTYCPFMSSLVAICRMNVIDHITEWQKLFTIIPEKGLSSSFIALLAFLFAVLFPVAVNIYNKPPPQHFYNYLYKNNPTIKLFNYFLLAFSRGILNPHIYA